MKSVRTSMRLGSVSASSCWRSACGSQTSVRPVPSPLPSAGTSQPSSPMPPPRSTWGAGGLITYVSVELQDRTGGPRWLPTTSPRVNTTKPAARAAAVTQ